MKKLLSVIAAAVLASCATAPTPAPQPAATAAAAASEAVRPAPSEISYEEALPVSVRSFYPNGDPSGVQTMQYNPQGLLVRQESLNGNGVLVEVRTGKARADGWRLTVVNAQTGEIKAFEDRTYGPHGELLVQTFLSDKEAVQATNEYQYDARLRKVQWLAKTGSGGLQAKTVYTYDRNGNNTKTEVFDAGGALTNVFESTFDAAGQIQTRKGFDAASNLVEQTNFTWKDGRKTKEETVKPLLRTIEYAYGEKSAPTAIVSSVRGKVVEKQALEYQWFTKTKPAPKE